MSYDLTQYSVNNVLKTHRNTVFVFLKMKIFNRFERYTLFALYGSIGLIRSGVLQDRVLGPTFVCLY